MIEELTTNEDVIREFKVVGVELAKELDLVERLKNWCILFDRSAENMADSWVAFQTKLKLPKHPTTGHLDRFHRDQLEKAKDDIDEAGDSTKPNIVKKDIPASDDMENLLAAYDMTDIKPIVKVEPKEDQEADAVLVPECDVKQEPMEVDDEDDLLDDDLFEVQAPGENNGKDSSLLETFGSNPVADSAESEKQISISVKSLKNVSSKDLYHLNWKEAISPISIIESGIRSKLADDGLAFGTIENKSAGTRNFLGRIVNDEFAKLNPSQLYFCELNSTRIPLDLSELPSYSLFPNQVVAITGKIDKSLESKHVSHDDYKQEFILMASEIHSLSNTLLPFPEIDLSRFSRPLNIMTASGPFYGFKENMPEDVALAAFDQLLDQISTRKPDLLILVGPFCEQPTDVTVQEMFQRRAIGLALMKRISAIKLPTRVVMVPSHIEFKQVKTMPTPPMELDADEFPPSQFTLASNPALIDINGLLIAVSSTDVMFHMSKGEISRGQPDRMARLCSHILEQRCLYPIMPAPPRVNMDYNQYDQLLLGDHLPHITILPSDLKRFIKDISGSVVLNPEKFSRRSTYAWLTVDFVVREGRKFTNQPLSDRVFAQIHKL